MNWIDLINRMMEPRVKGVIHIGANDGEEYPDYKKAGIRNMAFVEPQEAAFERLQKRTMGDPGVTTIRAACGKERAWGVLNIMQGPGEHHDYSSSLLPPKEHLVVHPEIKVVEQRNIGVYPFDDLARVCALDTTMFNLLVVDVQGFELDVLGGAPLTLAMMDYVLCEVNREEMYTGCAMVSDIDNFLSFRFRRVLTDWCGPKGAYGDALYIVG